MPNPNRAGALIYAKDLARLSEFYQRLLGMKLLHADAEHHVLKSADTQLIIHAIPPHIAATVTVSSPPKPRSEQAIKLFFTVPSLPAATDLAASLGGGMFGDEYAGPGFKVRNGYDAEGNIFHLREVTGNQPSVVHEHARLGGSRFLDVDLNASVFDDVNLRKATFENVALAGARFHNVDMSHASIDDACIEGLTINGVSIKELLESFNPGDSR
jgi:catechol 2,3-dioxygenase-like lactoylglutathione lyase family enzyme